MRFPCTVCYENSISAKPEITLKYSAADCASAKRERLSFDASKRWTAAQVLASKQLGFGLGFRFRFEFGFGFRFRPGFRLGLGLRFGLGHQNTRYSK